MEELSERTVLFVDDEKEILEILITTVQGKVKKVFTAELPSEALKIAEETPIDLAILDINMPEMSGIKLQAELKKINPRTHFIFVTGHGDRAEMRQAIQVGVEGFIEKPFSLDTVEYSIKNSLEKIGYESLVRELLEIFVMPSLKIDMKSFEKMSYAEKEKSLKAILSVAKMKILSKHFQESKT